MSKVKRIVRRANARLERQNVDWLDIPYFKITFNEWLDGLWIRFRLVPSWKFNWKIFEKLQSIYMEQWLNKSDASKKANDIIIAFYTAADACSKEWTKPFKVYISNKEIEK